MSERLNSPEVIDILVNDYRLKFNQFTRESEFPYKIISEPDYYGVNAVGIDDWAETVNIIKPKTVSGKVAIMQPKWNFLAVADLIKPLALYGSRHVGSMEILELDGYQAYAGVEYASFFYEDLENAMRALSQLGFNVGMNYDNSLDNRYLSIPINDVGQEIRITDTLITEMVEQKKDEGAVIFS